VAKLYITEFERVDNANPPVAPVPAITSQTVDLSGTSAQSSAFNPRTKMVRIHTDAICSILFGTNPTATTSHARLAADQTEYFALTTTGLKVAGITNS
jgi:hypothetical protein